MSCSLRQQLYWSLVIPLSFKIIRGSVCGHVIIRSDVYEEWDWPISRLLISDEGELTHCPDCVREMGILCYGCNTPIVIGDLVGVIYQGSGEVLPSHVFANPKKGQLVACSRCAFGQFPQRWVIPGTMSKPWLPL